MERRPPSRSRRSIAQRLLPRSGIGVDGAVARDRTARQSDHPPRRAPARSRRADRPLADRAARRVGRRDRRRRRRRAVDRPRRRVRLRRPRLPRARAVQRGAPPLAQPRSPARARRSRGRAPRRRRPRGRQVHRRAARALHARRTDHAPRGLRGRQAPDARAGRGQGRSVARAASSSTRCSSAATSSTSSGDYLQVGQVAFRIAEVREYALRGANLPLTGGRLLQAAMGLLVVAAEERARRRRGPRAAVEADRGLRGVVRTLAGR